jgi:hypothetical protein
MMLRSSLKDATGRGKLDTSGGIDRAGQCAVFVARFRAEREKLRRPDDLLITVTNPRGSFCDHRDS